MLASMAISGVRSDGGEGLRLMICMSVSWFRWRVNGGVGQMSRKVWFFGEGRGGGVVVVLLLLLLLLLDWDGRKRRVGEDEVRWRGRVRHVVSSGSSAHCRKSCGIIFYHG